VDDFSLTCGNAPLLISLPHDGTAIPEEIAARMSPAALAVPDTDWHVHRLYAPLAEALGASVIRPRWSRYVVDLNRPPDDVSLYPGQRVTGLVPNVTFGDEPIYRSGAEPDATELAARVDRFWRPYHMALQQEINRLHAAHGRVVLWEGHSIRSLVPMLFDGRLPDLNLGTAEGRSCRPATRERLAAVLAAESRYTHAVDGRFKGGYITRHYAEPTRGIEAIQLEISQVTYLDEDSFAFDEARAAPLVATIRRLLESAIAS